MLGWTRKKSVWVCAVVIIILSMPCVLGFNLLSGIQLLGEGSTIMDLEDFIVSNNLLPLGSLGYVLFCTKNNGWGWEDFLKEVNTGNGINFPSFVRPYVAYGIPLIIVLIYLKGYYDKFCGMGTAMLTGWMVVAVILLGFVLLCSFRYNKEKMDIEVKR